jgi:CRP-like cAMP-binding protein
MKLFQQYINAISPISPLTWEVIYPMFHRQTLSPKAFFAQQHQHAQSLAFLEKGCVRAFFTNKEGKEYNKQFFVGPSLIGAYSSLLTDTPNKIPQQALTNCTIWQADYHQLKKEYSNYHDLKRLGRKIAEHYFLEKEKKELEMALLNATQRYLLFRKEFPTLEQLIPQYHIASYLGISATQLSRLRKKLSQ